jgi:hypothetical protein
MSCTLCQAEGAPLVSFGFAVCCVAHQAHLDDHMGPTPTAHAAWCSWCRFRAQREAQERQRPAQTTLFPTRKTCPPAE